MDTLTILERDLKDLRDKWKDRWKEASKKSSPDHIKFRIDKLRAERIKTMIAKIKAKGDINKFAQELFGN